MSQFQKQLDDVAALLRNPPKSFLKKFGLYRRPKDYYDWRQVEVWRKPEVIIVVEKATPEQYKKFMEAWVKWKPTFVKASKANVTFLPSGSYGDIKVFFDEVVKSGGVTHTQCFKNTNILQYAEIHINKDISDGKRLMSVLLHEIGHALGIKDHSPNDDDCMHPTTYVDYVSSTDKGTLERNYREWAKHPMPNTGEWRKF